MPKNINMSSDLILVDFATYDKKEFNSQKKAFIKYNKQLNKDFRPIYRAEGILKGYRGLKLLKYINDRIKNGDVMELDVYDELKDYPKSKVGNLIKLKAEEMLSNNNGMSSVKVAKSKMFLSSPYTKSFSYNHNFSKFGVVTKTLVKSILPKTKLMKAYGTYKKVRTLPPVYAAGALANHYTTNRKTKLAINMILNLEHDKLRNRLKEKGRSLGLRGFELRSYVRKNMKAKNFSIVNYSMKNTLKYLNSTRGFSDSNNKIIGSVSVNGKKMPVTKRSALSMEKENPTLNIKNGKIINFEDNK